MAIRYDANYNAKINRVVKNFNQKRNRAIKRGFKSVPPPIKVSELKARYTTRKDLNKQLDILSKFAHGRDVLNMIENQGGARAIAWEFDYLKANEKLARDFFVREYKRLAPKTVNFPGEKMRLDNIKYKIDMLDLDITTMSQSQFNTYKSSIKEFVNKPKNYAAGYRGFLSQVERVMRYLNFDDDTIDRFFDKFSALSPEQFHKLYEDSDLISRIYEIADSPIYGEMKLNSSDEDAEKLIDTLMEETDDLVKKAQEEEMYSDFDFVVDMNKPDTSQEAIDEVIEFSRTIIDAKTSNKKPKKYPKSSLTKHQIDMLIALGGEDLIDETK